MLVFLVAIACKMMLEIVSLSFGDMNEALSEFE